jgi:uncharacterized protein
MPESTRPLAVVTGASSGIGVAFARRLAARGYDLVLVARREDRLKALAEELSKAGCRAHVAAHDLSSAEGPGALEKAVSAIGVPSLLVNNAGFGWKGRFEEMPAAKLDEMIQLNVVALSRTARAFIGALIETKGGLVNTASIGGLMPVPGFAIYSGTKAFVVSFTESLQGELAGRVRVVAVCPGPVPTEFNAVAGSEEQGILALARVRPEDVAEGALKKLERGGGVFVPGFLTRLIVFFSRMMPRFMLFKMSLDALQKK